MISTPASHRGVRRHPNSLIPAAAGWSTFPRAFLSLLVLGLAVVGGEWVVHQLEYLTEYGSGVGSVMATTPHRFYMMPLGIVLGLGIGSLLILALAIIAFACRIRYRLLHHVPARFARHVPGLTLRVRPRALAATILIVALCQATVYVLQENVEGVFVTGQWHGLSVLLAPQHATVIPFHLLVATLSALLLWSLSSLITGSRRAVRMARALVELLTRRSNPPSPRRGSFDRVPDLRLVAGALCLRSPPCAA